MFLAGSGEGFHEKFHVELDKSSGRKIDTAFFIFIF